MTRSGLGCPHGSVTITSRSDPLVRALVMTACPCVFCSRCRRAIGPAAHQARLRLVDVGDEQQLLDAILELSSDPAMARRLAERGRATVMERFEIGVVAQAYLDLFSSLVHGPSRPASPAAGLAGNGARG
jgi:hypothetical protein